MAIDADEVLLLLTLLPWRDSWMLIIIHRTEKICTYGEDRSDAVANERLQEMSIYVAEIKRDYSFAFARIHTTQSLFKLR